MCADCGQEIAAVTLRVKLKAILNRPDPDDQYDYWKTQDFFVHMDLTVCETHRKFTKKAGS